LAPIERADELPSDLADEAPMERAFDAPIDRAFDAPNDLAWPSVSSSTGETPSDLAPSGLNIFAGLLILAMM
jgi:hypothetical protein